MKNTSHACAYFLCISLFVIVTNSDHDLPSCLCSSYQKQLSNFSSVWVRLSGLLQRCNGKELTFWYLLGCMQVYGYAGPPGMLDPGHVPSGVCLELITTMQKEQAAWKGCIQILLMSVHDGLPEPQNQHSLFKSGSHLDVQPRWTNPWFQGQLPCD